MKELKVAILGEVLTLGENMQSLYEELVIVHKAVFHLHDMKHKCKDNSKYFKAIHKTIDSMHVWSTQYNGATSELEKKITQ